MEPADRAFVHAVNNLLAVVELQAAVAESAPDLETARRAIAVVRDAARDVPEHVQRFRARHADGGGGGGDGGRHPDRLSEEP